MRNLLERHFWPLAQAVFIAAPVAAALVVALLDLWPPLAPLLLVAGGLGYLVLAARFALELGERQADDAASRGATKTESAERFLADKPSAAACRSSSSAGSR